MKELIVATRNAKKLGEIKDLLKDCNLKITSLADYKDLPEIVEDGKTFAANALKKAVTIALYTKKLTMGEDSGLEVDFLGGRPGVYSARFSGEEATDDKNNQKLLDELRDVPFEKRTARYRCFMALADKDRLVDVVDGACEGVITTELHGTNGFGYDPLFVPDGQTRTFAELPPAIKNRLSHRGRPCYAVLVHRPAGFL